MLLARYNCSSRSSSSALSSGLIFNHLTKKGNVRPCTTSVIKITTKAKNIIDADGSINPLKIQLSTIFTGGDINIPAFENFVNKNPEYQGVFNDWNKLQEDYMALFLKPLNAYRDSTSIDKMRELRNFLIDFRKKL